MGFRISSQLQFRLAQNIARGFVSLARKGSRIPSNTHTLHVYFDDMMLNRHHLGVL